MSQHLRPASRTLREVNCDARRERILDAARRLIVRGGMAALSMRKLAQEAGLSVTTLYNLFGVREDILHALVVDGVDRMDRVLEKEAPLEDPLARCRAVITVSIRHIVEDESFYRPMLAVAIEQISRESRADRRIAERAGRMQTVAIEAAIEKALLRADLDPVLLGQQIYHGYELALQQWALGTIDVAAFEARALYGLYVALLAVAEDEVRPELQKQLRKVERELRRAPTQGAAPCSRNSRSRSSRS